MHQMEKQKGRSREASLAGHGLMGLFGAYHSNDSSECGDRVKRWPKPLHYDGGGMTFRSNDSKR